MTPQDTPGGGRPYYQDSLVTLYHGDSREIAPALAFDAVLADPPYGIALDADYEASYGIEERLAAVRKRHAPVHGDDEPFDPAWLLAFQVPTVLFGANYYRERVPIDGGWIVWDKVGRNDVRRLPGWSDGELAWCSEFKGVRIFRHAWNGFSRSSENSFHVHPTQKPVDLMVWVLAAWLPTGIVLDPYMGSGPVVAAAKRLNRRAIGIEIEERYCEIAANRCRQEVLGLPA
jgi:site-specific DNA-methyltransferase (adenine-specific)